jgi:hypothetical protein
VQPAARAEAGEQGMARVPGRDDDFGEGIGPETALGRDARVARCAVGTFAAAGRERAVFERREAAHAAARFVAQLDRQRQLAEGAQVASRVDPAGIDAA